jgi:hypothetical protein
MDISYFYCNSKDSTIVDTLNKIFVAYQIGAYIDEYGIMKFLSLHNILSSNTSTLSLSDFNVKQGGFSISNKAKPGKISLRYQVPKVKQSPSLQNVTDPMIKNSSSFLYATSNDVVWQQQSIDSVGINYINGDIEKNTNEFHKDAKFEIPFLNDNITSVKFQQSLGLDKVSKVEKVDKNISVARGKMTDFINSAQNFVNKMEQSKIIKPRL